MAKTESQMTRLGSSLPAFALPQAEQAGALSQNDLKSEVGTLVAFMSNHCPYVQHIKEGFGRLSQHAMQNGLDVLIIASNDVSAYPDDGAPMMASLAQSSGWEGFVLMDETQEVAQTFGAACTPDFFLFDFKKRLVYRGQMDGARPGNDAPNDGQDLRAAIDAMTSGSSVNTDQKPSLGCNIKWKHGNAPAYFGG